MRATTCGLLTQKLLQLNASISHGKVIILTQEKKSLSYMYLLITCSAFHHSEWFALVKGKCSELEHKKLFTTVNFCNQLSL